MGSFFEFAGFIKIQSHMINKMILAISSFCQGLSELVFKVCGNCYFGRNTSLLKKEKTATGNLMSKGCSQLSISQNTTTKNQIAN